MKYARVLDVSVWNASHAKNIAHNLATGDIVVNVDSDNFIGAGFCEYINNVFGGTLRTLVAQGVTNLSCAGRIALYRESFQQFGGYDEILQVEGFGYEDYDLVRRLQASGYLIMPIDNTKYLQAFWHSNEERSAGYTAGVHDIAQSSHANYLKSCSNIDMGLTVANSKSVWGNASILYGINGLPMVVSSSILSFCR